MEKSDNGRFAMVSTNPQLTTDELSLDVSAFLHFLRENFEGEKEQDLPTFWMLIPKSIDVEWRPGTNGFFLEKEIFSRKIWIVAEPMAETATEIEKLKRKAELLLMFQSAIAESQAQQIILLLSKLATESRIKMIENFQRYKLSQEQKKLT
ncbi:MAG: hypothetical protein ACXVCY_11405 [Pseudobdellovibrionaceae bacterium]